MDDFEYLIALVSVIAGLGITRALSGSAKLLNARRAISISWIPICWTASILLWLVAFWWFTFLLSSYEEWSPWLHIFVLIYAGAIYFLLALLHPEPIEAGHDTLEHLLENRKSIFGALLIVALIDIADTWIKAWLGLSTPPLSRYITFMVPWIAFSIIAMYVRNRKYHGIFAPVFLMAVLLWIGFSIEGILEIVASDA
jgi:hypothetical protein